MLRESQASYFILFYFILLYIYRHWQVIVFSQINFQESYISTNTLWCSMKTFRFKSPPSTIKLSTTTTTTTTTKKHLRIVRGFTTSLIKPQFSNFFLAKPLFWVAKKLANTSTIFSKATLYSNSTTLFNIVALPK